jgi:hypothetical protein
VSESFWLGPTYEFFSGEWCLKAGIHAESGRLEWLLTRTEGGVETVSHSFALEPHATRIDLEELLDELPEGTTADLVAQVEGQLEPRLLSDVSGSEGLA